MKNLEKKKKKVESHEESKNPGLKCDKYGGW